MKKIVAVVALSLILAFGALVVLEQMTPVVEAEGDCFPGECVPIPGGGECCQICCRVGDTITCSDRPCPV